MINSEQSIYSPTLNVTPLRSLVDEHVDIRLSGFAPDQSVTVRAETIDGARKQWVSYATFVTDAQGTIDGTYDDVDPMGLFWSMSLADKKERAFFVKTKQTPIKMTFTAEVDGKIVVSANIERLFAAPGVTKTAVEEDGLMGTFFQPAAPGTYPAVIVLCGSDGGMRENAAALLASRGYAALALAYFGVEDLPKNLVNIPLEYFETAIRWLQTQASVHGERLAAIGLSRGGELALLLAATFPEVKAVVAGSPSGIVQAGIMNSMDFSKPAWTYRGEPLPHMVSKLNFFDMLSFFWKWMTRTPITYKAGFLKTLKNREAVEKATIPVEKIHGPVLLISGQDDQLWPSALFADMVIDRLARNNHPYPYKHLSYKEAGHFVCFPYGLPSLPPMLTLSPVGGMLLNFGGNAKANALAASESWAEILAFLEESLKTTD